MKVLIVLSLLTLGACAAKKSNTYNYYYDYSVGDIYEICQDLPAYEFVDLDDSNIRVYYDGIECRVTNK